LARLHSECLTGDALGSLRCDCRAQLKSALKAIALEPSGVVLYLRQEGRGIGLFKKVAAYALQDQGLDTVDANLALGMPNDCRNFKVAALMLQALEVRSIRLMTNNPLKVSQILSHGVKITKRVPHFMTPNLYNIDYLKTKASRSGHLFPFRDEGK
jgi:GTP cyclohydrolase II